MINVQIMCNWASSEAIARMWNKMTPNGDFVWGNMTLVWDQRSDLRSLSSDLRSLSSDLRSDLSSDLRSLSSDPSRPPPASNWWSRPAKRVTVYINYTPDMKIHPSPRLFFRMEPRGFDVPDALLNATSKRAYHDTHLNLLEWHLAKRWSELFAPPDDKQDRISAIVSAKNVDIGHKRRLGLIALLDDATDALDVFGAQQRFPLKHFKGPLPVYQKDDGLFPYKYTIAVENSCCENYVTEKLVDGILAECLVFYWGSDTADSLFGSAFIRLDLANLSNAVEIILDAVKNREWERRISAIRQAKHEILFRKNALAQIAKEIERLI